MFTWHVHEQTYVWEMERIVVMVAKAVNTKFQYCKWETSEYPKFEATEPGIQSPKHDLFPTLTLFGVPKPNQSISTALSQHKIQNWTLKNAALQHIPDLQEWTLPTFILGIGLVLLSISLKVSTVETWLAPQITESKFCSLTSNAGLTGPIRYSFYHEDLQIIPK